MVTASPTNIRGFHVSAKLLWRNIPPAISHASPLGLPMGVVLPDSFRVWLLPCCVELPTNRDGSLEATLGHADHH